jgi:hypothetical protein
VIPDVSADEVLEAHVELGEPVLLAVAAQVEIKSKN